MRIYLDLNGLLGLALLVGALVLCYRMPGDPGARGGRR